MVRPATKGHGNLRVKPRDPEPDITPPTVNIISPGAGQVISASSVTVNGTAADNRGVAAVEVSIDGGPFTLASGSSSWSKSYSGLADGVHTVTARAKDTSGNYSSSKSVAFSTRTEIQPVPPGFILCVFTATASGVNTNLAASMDKPQDFKHIFAHRSDLYSLLPDNRTLLLTATIAPAPDTTQRTVAQACTIARSNGFSGVFYDPEGWDATALPERDVNSVPQFASQAADIIHNNGLHAGWAGMGRMLMLNNNWQNMPYAKLEYLVMQFQKLIAMPQNGQVTWPGDPVASAKAVSARARAVNPNCKLILQVNVGVDTANPTIPPATLAQVEDVITKVGTAIDGISIVYGHPDNNELFRRLSARRTGVVPQPEPEPTSGKFFMATLVSYVSEQQSTYSVLKSSSDISRFHVGLGDTMTSDQHTLTQNVPHRWKSAEFFTRADFRRHIAAMKSNGYRIASYDHENNDVAEFNNFVPNALEFAQIAHDNGFLAQFCPAQYRMRLDGSGVSQTDRNRIIKAYDLMHWQFQVAQDDRATFERYCRDNMTWAKQQNPNIIQTVQLTTTQNAPSLAMFKERWMYAKQFADGVTIWTDNSIASKQLVRDFLAWFNQFGR